MMLMVVLDAIPTTGLTVEDVDRIAIEVSEKMLLALQEISQTKTMNSLSNGKTLKKEL